MSKFTKAIVALFAAIGVAATCAAGLWLFAVNSFGNSQVPEVDAQYLPRQVVYRYGTKIVREGMTKPEVMALLGPSDYGEDEDYANWIVADNILDVLYFQVVFGEDARVTTTAVIQP